MTSDFFRVVNEARSHSLGPFSPRFNIQTCLLEGLQKFLPADAHERVNGKLHISLTRVYDGKNVIVSQFHSREDLLQVSGDANLRAVLVLSGLVTAVRLFFRLCCALVLFRYFRGFCRHGFMVCGTWTELFRITCPRWMRIR